MLRGMLITALAFSLTLGAEVIMQDDEEMIYGDTRFICKKDIVKIHNVLENTSSFEEHQRPNYTEIVKELKFNDHLGEAKALQIWNQKQQKRIDELESSMKQDLELIQNSLCAKVLEESYSNGYTKYKTDKPVPSLDKIAEVLK